MGLDAGLKWHVVRVRGTLWQARIPRTRFIHASRPLRPRDAANFLLFARIPRGRGTHAQYAAGGRRHRFAAGTQSSTAKSGAENHSGGNFSGAFGPGAAAGGSAKTNYRRNIAQAAQGMGRPP